MIPLLPEKMKEGMAVYALLAGSLVLAAFFVVFFLSDNEGNAGPEERIDCEINRGACTGTVGKTGMTATFDIEPIPVRPMTRLRFSIDLKSNGLPVTDREIALNLTMPQMYMAQNSIRLAHKGQGRYEGEGTIVRCPTGRKIWKAEVLVENPAAGRNSLHNVAYTFRVED